MTGNDGACSRRRLLEVAGAGGLGAIAMGACSPAGPAKAIVPPAIKGKVLARTGDVPAGGGVVLDKWKIVITQPSPGVFKAFSATCTHQGCSVGRPRGGVIRCPCHGSEFDAVTGAVRQGPAGAPLPQFTVRLQGDGITVV